ncbi:radical SAM protein [Stigmatella erecta]|uniref:Radical SAM core domain-containing protein n=1 Tax=Stigmatella erecta TaxID=83460 RepID=A0A1I0B3M8_9BACT|nr:radical SAM protein [Stigmatella erecta]SET01340.1 hypothetical protein SAMN05443639_101904 [Stigmatella erecta]
MHTSPLAAGLFQGRKTLSIMPTFTCPAACKDCGTLSSPKDRTRLALSTILDAIHQAKELGFYNVVFTGGEATLRWDDLLAAIREADSLGFPTRIVTNAHWAHSREAAHEKIARLMDAGLSEINYSTGDEHVRFIPLERVVHATVAAAERHLPTHIMVELRAERRVTRELLLGQPAIAALAPELRECLRVIESPWMPLSPGETQRYPDHVAVTAANLPSRTGCDSVLQTYTLQSDGRIGSCCGLGLRVIPELNVATAQEGSAFLREAIEAAENDFLKLWIRYKGPEKILAWAAERDPSIQWEGRFGHHCQACQMLYRDPRIARVIREHYKEIVAEVVQSAWLDERYAPSRLRRGASDGQLDMTR